MADFHDLAIQDAQCCCCKKSDLPCAIFRSHDGQSPAPVCRICMMDMSRAMYGQEQRALFDQMIAEAQETKRS
mgnify:FL=1